MNELRRRAVTTEVWVRNHEVLWRRSGSAVALKLPGQDDIVVLQDSGQALWEVLAEPATLRQVATVLAGRYSVHIEVVERDLTPVLEELERRSVVLRRTA